MLNPLEVGKVSAIEAVPGMPPEKGRPKSCQALTLMPSHVAVDQTWSLPPVPTICAQPVPPPLIY